MAAAAWGFALGFVASVPIGGAVSVFIAQRGLAGRWRNGLALACGSALAEGVWCLVILAGAAHLLEQRPVVGAAARWIGSVVLVGLGAYYLRRHTSLPASGRFPAPPRRSLGADLRNGVLLIAANPLVPFNWLVLITAATALGLDPDIPPAPFAGGVALGVFSWFSLLLWALSAARHRLTARQIDAILRALGVLLLLAGLLVLWQQVFPQWGGPPGP